MSDKDTVYEYIIVVNQKHIWLPQIKNGITGLLDKERSLLFRKHFKGYSNSIVSKEEWEKLKENLMVFRIIHRDLE